jgi:hypothetical protein
MPPGAAGWPPAWPEDFGTDWPAGALPGAPPCCAKPAPVPAISAAVATAISNLLLFICHLHLGGRMRQPVAGCSHTNAGPVSTFRSAHRRHVMSSEVLKRCPVRPTNGGVQLHRHLSSQKGCLTTSPRLLDAFPGSSFARVSRCEPNKKNAILTDAQTDELQAARTGVSSPARAPLISRSCSLLSIRRRGGEIRPQFTPRVVERHLLSGTACCITAPAPWGCPPTGRAEHRRFDQER